MSGKKHGFFIHALLCIGNIHWESENKDVEGTPSKIPTEKFFLVNSFCYINLFSYFSAETDFYIK
jgi:hypothetical protein